VLLREAWRVYCLDSVEYRKNDPPADLTVSKTGTVGTNINAIEKGCNYFFRCGCLSARGIFALKIPTFRPYGTLENIGAVVFYPHHAPSRASDSQNNSPPILPSRLPIIHIFGYLNLWLIVNSLRESPTPKPQGKRIKIVAISAK
jgi:hypothetical protein